MMCYPPRDTGCSSGCPTGCTGRGDCGHRQTITIYTATAGAEYWYDPYSERRNPPGWGELNIRGAGPLPPLPLRSIIRESVLIRWMAKALIGGQK